MSAPRPITTCVSAADLPPVPREGPALFGPRAQIALGTCACAAASLFVYAVDPTRHAVYPQCLLYNLTGLYCAGCGATRALHALLHGRVLVAAHDNLLFVALLPVLVYLAAGYGLKAWRDNVWPKVHLDPRRVLGGGTGLFLLAMAFTVVRNLPGETFAWLRPL
jgi:hypothetical protein